MNLVRISVSEPSARTTSGRINTRRINDPNKEEEVKKSALLTNDHPTITDDLLGRDKNCFLIASCLFLCHRHHYYDFSWRYSSYHSSSHPFRNQFYSYRFLITIAEFVFEHLWRMFCFEQQCGVFCACFCCDLRVKLKTDDEIQRRSHISLKCKVSLHNVRVWGSVSPVPLCNTRCNGPFHFGEHTGTRNISTSRFTGLCLQLHVDSTDFIFHQDGAPHFRYLRKAVAATNETRNRMWWNAMQPLFPSRRNWRHVGLCEGFCVLPLSTDRSGVEG